MDYTTLTPEQAAKAARAETLKEVIEFCKTKLSESNVPFTKIGIRSVKLEAERLLNAFQ